MGVHGAPRLVLLASLAVMSSACDGSTGIVGIQPPDNPLACAGPDDCGESAPFCGPNQSCVECLSTAHCPEDGEICRQNRCQRGCIGPDQCEQEEVCHPVAGVCVECLADQDCTRETDRRLCDPAGSRCVECLLMDDCPTSKPQCFDGQCHECANDNGCPSGQRCFDLECVDTCTSDDDCSDGSCNVAAGVCEG